MRDPDAADATATVGSALVVVGCWLPWVQVRPGYEGPVPMVYIAGMNPGLAGPDLLLVGLALAGLAAAALPTTPRRLVRGGTGLLVAVLVVSWTLLGGAADYGVFVPDAGVPVALLGGLVLAAAGATGPLPGRGGPDDGGDADPEA